MHPFKPPFEIHIHGDVPVREDVSPRLLEEALRPLWAYVGARSLSTAAASLYDDEPGIRYDAGQSLLQLCWTLEANEDFRQSLDDLCMGLNEIAAAGAVLEVSFYDVEFDEEEAPPEAEAKDDFVLLFVGPNPAAIMQVQRDLLVHDLLQLMERHFERSELGELVDVVDKLFTGRFNALMNSIQLGGPPRGGNGQGGHGGGRKPRHLH